MEVIVPDDQLSLAIGRRGQNVRLASRLTNWHIDVKSESRYERQKQAGYQTLLEIEGVTEEIADRLYEAGITSIEEFVEAGLTELEDLSRLSRSELEGMQSEAPRRFSSGRTTRHSRRKRFLPGGRKKLPTRRA